MNLLYGELGGRPRKNDDFMLMQAEAYKAMVAPFKHLEAAKGPFILHGVIPDGITKSISAGMVFLNGEFLEFDGATNVTFPAQLGVLTELNTLLQYQDGNTKNTRQRRSASLDSAADFSKTLSIDTSVYQELNDLIGYTYGNQSFTGTKTFKDNLIAKTLNVYDTLVSLRNDLTSAISTLNQTITNQITNVMQSIATINTNLASAQTAIATKVTKKIDGTGWLDLVLTTGFVYDNPGYFKPQIRRTEDGFAHLRGYVSFAANASGLAAQLPVGFGTSLVTKQVLNSIAAEFKVQVSIENNGLYINPLNVSSNATRIFLLDGISYFVDGVV